MDLPPFLLDQWLSRHDFATPPIAYNFASSTGPRWTLDQIAALGDGLDPLGDTPIAYAPPEGGHALRAAIGAFVGVDPDWVVVTTGSSEGLSILCCLLEKPGADLLIPDPGYPAYAAMAAAWRLGVRPYPLDRADGYAQQADPILAALTADTTAVLVNTPHNPSGSVMAHREIARLAGTLAGRRIPLIVDDVYHPIYFGAPQPSASSIENVIVVGDMSKALSLPGLRMGWLIDRDADRRARLIDARSYFTISHSPLIERIATHALANAPAILARAQAAASHNVQVLEDVIARSAGVLSWSPPAGGTTAFAWFSDGRDSRPFCEALAERGVLVAPGDCFGHPAHMRIGIAGEAAAFDKGMSLFADCLAEFE